MYRYTCTLLAIIKSQTHNYIIYNYIYNYIIDAYYNELIVVIQQVAMVVSSYKAR